MKHLIVSLIALFSVIMAADLSRFTGPAFTTATVKNHTQVYASVDAKTSATGALLIWARPGQTYEVVGVYSPYVKVQAAATGWAWIELLKAEGDAVICDPQTHGAQGVALVESPNVLKPVLGALNPGERGKIIDYWPRWVKVKVGSGIGYIFATEVDLK